MLEATFNTQKQEAYKLNEDAIQYAILRRDVESSRDLYEGLLKKLKEAGVLAGLKSSNINIVDSASVPIEPVEPKIPLNIALGCMGVLAGLKSSNINIVDSASVPIEPVEPKIPLNIALGCMGGLLFGVALAFVVENIDN